MFWMGDLGPIDVDRGHIVRADNKTEVSAPSYASYGASAALPPVPPTM